MGNSWQGKHLTRQNKHTKMPLGEIDEWIKEISATWDERLQRLKALLENEATDTDSHDRFSALEDI